MKPIVIYPKNDSEKVTLTKKEFEDYLKQAYDAGYADGYAAGKAINWWNYPTNNPTVTPSITWQKESNIDPYKVTCCNTSKTFATGGTIANANLFYPGDNAVEKVVPCDAHNDI